MKEQRKSVNWFVYMIVTDDRALYTGISTDVDRRFMEHLDSFRGLSNKGAKYFRGRKPIEVVYRERCDSRSAASSREYQIKKMSVLKKQALISGAK